jgi:polygalacturonase
MADNAKLQALLDKAGTVTVPAGIYNIDVSKLGLMVRSNTVLNLKGVELRVIPNGFDRYRVLTLAAVSNVTINDGLLIGDRDKHTGDEGEWGYGILVAQNSKNIKINRTWAARFWGDGMYVQAGSSIAFDACQMTGNRRNGLSIISCDGVTVKNCKFLNQSGVNPQVGIDLEPDASTQTVQNVRIENNTFKNNKRGHILLWGKKGPIKGIVVGANTYNDSNTKIRVVSVKGVADGNYSKLTVPG